MSTRAQPTHSFPIGPFLLVCALAAIGHQAIPLFMEGTHASEEATPTTATKTRGLPQSQLCDEMYNQYKAVCGETATCSRNRGAHTLTCEEALPRLKSALRCSQLRSKFMKRCWQGPKTTTAWRSHIQQIRDRAANASQCLAIVARRCTGQDMRGWRRKVAGLTTLIQKLTRGT